MVLRRTLKIHENFDLVTPAMWSPASIAESRRRLRDLTLADELRKAREAALNDLESYMYSSKGKMSDDEDQYKLVSTEEQRTEVYDACADAETWLEDNYGATLDEFKTKRKALKAVAEPIFKRLTERSARPKAVEKARISLAGARETSSKWNETMPQITEVEKAEFEGLIVAAETWLTEKEAAQAELAGHEQAAFEAKSVKPQLAEVSAMLNKLMRKPKPTPPKEGKPRKKVKANNSTVGEEEEDEVVDSDTDKNTGEEDPVKVTVDASEDADAAAEAAEEDADGDGDGEQKGEENDSSSDSLYSSSSTETDTEAEAEADGNEL